MSNPPTIATPTQLGGFEIIRRLGSGGMAEVFVAKKTGAEGIVKILVLKRILGGGHRRRFRTMFIEEAQLATRLNHPNIVQVYDFQDAGDEGLLLAMEYVEGTDLGKLASAARAKNTRIPPWVAAHIVAEAAKGLHYAHERKEGGTPLEIVHRDVSPQNILLSYEGATKIADFGIAATNLFREDIGVIKGKYGYMSPEQARGEKVDRRSDIYALGVILHELLTGRPLHGSLVGDELLSVVREGVVEPPSTFAHNVPHELEAIVMRALSKAREDRFQTARDFSAAVMRAFLQRQELIDASAVEATIQQLVGRELTSPGVMEPSMARSLASLPPLPSTPDSQKPRKVRPSEVPIRGRRRGERVSREVRHVAIVTLRLHGLDELELVTGQEPAAVTAEKIRTTLDDIAYKRGARWTWDSTGKARAILGLLSNPARAAADSAWLALDVHEALATAYEDLAVPIQASIGIVRAVAKGERDTKGHLVRHELQAPADDISNFVGEQAPVGRTWASGGLYRLVRREFRWTDAGALELPPDPRERMPASMRLHALERALTRDERLEELALAPDELVGREAEKADLHAAYHRAVRGKGRVVARVVIGEMGIGKTSLVSAFLSELPQETHVVRIECSPARSEVLYGDISALVRELSGTTADQPPPEVIDRIRALVEPVSASRAPAIAVAMAELIGGNPLGDIEDEDAQYRKRLIFDGVRALIASLASQKPLVIVIDALQFSHGSGLELISRLLERQVFLPVLALFVMRPDERALPYLEGVVRIELGGLSAVEQVQLIEARLGVEKGVRELCSDLVAKVAGNPFFLLEMVDALLERGTFEIREEGAGRHALVRVERGGDGEQALPSTLEQLIGDRLRELPADEHAIVEWLAVAGGPLALRDLATLSDLDVGAPVERLFARGLCEKKAEKTVDFRHPLARDVAYLALEPAERTRMHRRLAEHLVETPLAKGLSAAMAARHFARGEAPVRAAELYLEAAAAARSSLQSRHSIRFFERALSLLPPDDPRRLIAHEALEAIYRVLGRHQPRRRHLQALRSLARKLGQPKWVSLALLRTARQSLDEGFSSVGLPQAEKAEQVAKLAESPTLEIQAQALQSELLRELGDFHGALRTCERALATAASPSVNARLRGEALRTRGVLLRRVGRVREAVECHVEAIAIFRKTGAKRQEARAKNSLAYAMFVLERYEDAIALALESIRIDLAIGGRFQLAKTMTNIGYAYARLGDASRALVYLARARELHEKYSDQDSRADTLLVSAEVLLEQGDFDSAHLFCGDAGALNDVTKNAYDYVHECIVRALLARAEGDHASASAHAREARHAAEGRALVSFSLFATAIEAVARVDAGETETGARLARSALDALENAGGTEFGLDVRRLCADALLRAGAPEAPRARARARAHARGIAQTIRDPRLRRLFLERPVVAKLLSEEEIPGGNQESES